MQAYGRGRGRRIAPPSAARRHKRHCESSSYGHPMAIGVRRTAVLLGAALAAWAVAVVRMRGMDAGPGTDLGGVGWVLRRLGAVMVPKVVASAAAVVLLLFRAVP